MRYKGGMVLDENFQFKKKDMWVRDGKLVFADKIGCQFDETIDVENCLIIPGLIDMHLHGSAGFDFSNASVHGLTSMAEYLAKNGITAFTPATMTMPEESILESCCVAAEYTKKIEEMPSFNRGKSKLLGIYMEGPYFSKDKKGAQDERYLKLPDTEQAKKIYEASHGLIKVICVAPELDGAIDFIRKWSKYLSVSIGHTACNFEQAKAAFTAGASHVTHLYNGMRPFLQRSPGVVGAAWESEGVMVELIADGNHVDPNVVRATFKLFDSDRIVLISDSLSICGSDKAVAVCGENMIYERDGVCILMDGTMAGSCTNLYECMKRAVSFGVSVEDAVKAASLNPAKVLRVDGERGSLADGKTADFIICDRELNIKEVYIGGQRV